MVDWLVEVLLVLSHSTKTKLALAFGVAFFIGFQIMGPVLVSGLELRGPLAPLTDVLGDHLMRRYDMAAWISLGSFLLVAVKTYCKDRRRLFGS
ncbi:hypothetical protein [Methylibium sp. Root1272]|uniref:hypothetical protein n=1 Tax=Methylibium sp. Root1272 TaxID=1736441 RepID=UPI0006FD546D|nr:hypothetical protein [Methylibium sp. Root1272]KQW69842.1 hypothetical protein ASC67_04970 [Methylibium sp. Root1272]